MNLVIHIEDALASQAVNYDQDHEPFIVSTTPAWVFASLDSWMGVNGRNAMGLRVLTNILYPELYQPPTTPIAIEQIKLTADIEPVEEAVFRNLRKMALRWMNVQGRMWITQLEHDIMTIEREVIQSPFAMSVAENNFAGITWKRNDRWILAETQRRLQHKGIHLGVKEIEDYLGVIDSIYTLADNAGVEVEVQESSRKVVYIHKAA